ncbi:MAG: ABC transporter permease [Clostridia bacterium]|nr:ABC transporter permease [Clostridia bacterium]
MKSKERIQYLLSLGVSILIALAIGALLMLVSGHDPVQGYRSLIEGAGFIGPRKAQAIGNTLYKSAQLIITGLATAVASSAGVFNVGGEGQMYLGALGSCYLATLLVGVSPWIAMPLCFLAAVLCGSVYAFIPAVMKVKLNINEVISTIMLNSVAIFFCAYMAKGPLKTTERGITAGTQRISSVFQFDRIIFSNSDVLSERLRMKSNLTTSVIWIALITLLIWYLMSHTTLGYRMNLSGQNSRFARFIGIRADWLGIVGMLISGAMCGALGMFENFALHSRFNPEFSNEIYFDGMLVAMIMRYRPLGIILMSFFFGALKTGAVSMQQDIPSELILIVQSVVIFLMAAQEGIVARLRVKHARKHPSIAKEVG